MPRFIIDIKTKLNILLAFIMIIMLSVITGIVVYSINNKSFEDFYSNSDQQMKIIEESFKRFNEQVDMDINMLASNEIIQSADSTVTTYRNRDISFMTPSKNGGIEEEIYNIFNQYALSHPGTLYVYLALEENEGYIQWPESIMAISQYKPTTRNWYIAGISGNGEIVRTEPYYDVALEEYIISNIRTFNDKNGQFKGIIGIDVKQTVISDMLSSLKSGDTGFLMMIHTSGLIIADGHNPQNNFLHVDEVDIKGLEQVFSDEDGMFSIFVEDEIYYVNAKKGNNDIIFVSVMSEKELEASSRDISKTVLMFIVIMAIVLGALAIVLIKQDKNLKHIIYFDSLTGIHNRYAMYSYIKKIVKNKDELYTSSFIVVNIDNFRVINDVYGHEFGDEVLKYLGRKFADLEDEYISVGRVAGDEFLVILREEEYDKDVNALIYRINEFINKKIIIGMKSTNITASIGVVAGIRYMNNQKEILKKADLALNKAKQRKITTMNWAFYDDSLATELEQKIEFQKSIIRAIQNNEFYLNYQPYINPTSNRIEGFEALIRWKSQRYGYVSPFKLIQNIEEMGLINEVSEWVLKEACNCIKDINRHRVDKLKISVNISALQLKNPDFFERTRDVIEEVDIEPNIVCLELTETTLIYSMEAGSKLIDQLKEYGFLIALDDFGTGYSSLSYFDALDIDIVKIDKSFVDGIVTDNMKVLIIEAIINLAKYKGIDIIAEGVESQAQLDIIRRYGCNVIQGYYYSKPLNQEMLKPFIGEFMKD